MSIQPGELAEFRHLLHRRPELSGSEEATSKRLVEFLARTGPDLLVDGVAGNGVAAIYNGRKNGGSILLRCDMDALPIPEDLDIPYRSSREGISHKCGHDGHMAILAGVGAWLEENPLEKGSVVLLFQPGEETGEGAEKVLEGTFFHDLKLDMVFALHNLPGFPLGSIVTRVGIFSSASLGMTVDLLGSPSHAAQPLAGRSPALAVAHLIQALPGIPRTTLPLAVPAKVTVVHAGLGEKSFGTSPGHGTIMATLRSSDDDSMDQLVSRAEDMARKTAAEYGLECIIRWTQAFPPVNNDIEAVDHLRNVSKLLGLKMIMPEDPFPWSEDFGHFTGRYKGAMFGLGAGLDSPALHTPSYDFRDELIPLGVNIYAGIIRSVLKPS